MNKDELRKILAGAHVARCGGTMYVYSDEEKNRVVDEVLKKARRTGEIAFFPHAKVFFSKDQIIDTSKEASAQYIWDRSGNRVKCEVVKHTIYKIGDKVIHDKEVVGTCFADPND